MDGTKHFFAGVKKAWMRVRAMARWPISSKLVSTGSVRDSSPTAGLPLQLSTAIIPSPSRSGLPAEGISCS